jgi:hypothetical protein
MRRWWQKWWGILLIGVTYGFVIGAVLDRPILRLVGDVLILLIAGSIVLWLHYRATPMERPGLSYFLMMLVALSAGNSFIAAIDAIPVRDSIHLTIEVSALAAYLMAWATISKLRRS